MKISRDSGFCFKLDINYGSKEETTKTLKTRKIAYLEQKRHVRFLFSNDCFAQIHHLKIW